jgi:hypothetical protein
LSLKTKVDGLSVVWPQNHWDDFLRFALKTGGDGFLWFGLRTGGDGFLVWTLKPRRLQFVSCATKPMGGCDGVGHTSRSSGLLRVEASLARVSQSGLKTGGGATVGGGCGTITEVTSESS